MNYYKMFKGIVALAALVFIGCEESVHEPLVFDNVGPGAVKDVVLTPVAGGFDVSFTSPSDLDLLYVKASFQTENQEPTELRVSKFGKELEVRGFVNQEEKAITFVAVDKSGNESSTVTAVGIPGKAPITLVGESMDILSTFGGVKFLWTNESENNMVIDHLVKDNVGNVNVRHTTYSADLNGKYGIRGYEPTPTFFAAVIRDQYGNSTDTIYPNTPDQLIIPKFEEELDQSKFGEIHLNDDADWYTFGANFAHLYDGIVNVQPNFARGEYPGKKRLTLDLGVEANLSRYKFYLRNFRIFESGSPRTFTIYGRTDEPEQDGSMDNWIKLRDCETLKPSGEGSQITDEDRAMASIGHEFDLEDTPPVRYIRIIFHENWAISSFVSISELKFYGEVIN